MSKKSKDFYVWAINELKTTYEWWGIDMMSMYDHIKKDFPNATKAIHKMYENLNETDFYKSNFLVFENVEYVYQSIANLIPHHEGLLFDIITKEQAQEYKRLNICSWKRFVVIKRIDLLMAVLLFTEEFILQPISSNIVNITDNKLSVEGTFVKLEVSKEEDKTHVSILVRDAMLLEYVILN